MATLLPSCAEKHPAIERGAWTIDTPSARADSVVEEAAVSCESASDCPSTVAMLVVRSDHGQASTLSQCTGFLISDSLLVTNSHCVPEDLRRDASSCSGRISAHFPRAGAHGAEKAECEKVVIASAIRPLTEQRFGRDPDYAILKLAQVTKRGALEVSRAGLPDDLSLRIYAVDPLSTKKISGRLRSKACVTTQGTVLIPGFTHDHHPVAGSRGCEILQGNSGAPAIDSEGRVRAVAYGFVPSTAPAGRAPASAEPARKSVTLMTNLACMRLPESLGAGHPAAECARAAMPSAADEQVGRRDSAALAKAFESWRATEAPRELRFQLKDTTVEIECVEAPVKAGPVVVRYRTPTWTFEPKVDENYRMALLPVLTSRLDTEIELDGQKLIASGQADGQARFRDPSGKVARTLARLPLRACNPGRDSTSRSAVERR